MNREEVRELAGRVLEHLLPGIQIRVADSTFQSLPPRDDLSMEVEGNISLAAGVDAAISCVMCSATYDLRAVVTPREDEPVVMWRSRVTLHGMWLAEQVEMLGHHELGGFAIEVGMMQMHPYARAYIQDSITRSGWPAYTLDVVSDPSIFFADRSGDIDLDGIGLIDNAG